MSSGRFSARDLIIAGYLVLAGSTVVSFVNYVRAVPLGSMGWRNWPPPRHPSAIWWPGPFRHWP